MGVRARVAALAAAGIAVLATPHRRLLTRALHDPRGLVPAGPGAILAAQQRNRIVRISGLAGCL